MSNYTQLESLPESLKPAKATYSLFKKFLLKSSQTKNTKLFILTYLFGLQTVQILIRHYDTLVSDADKEVCTSTINEMISSLEKIKSSQTDKKKTVLKISNLFKGKSDKSEGGDFLNVINEDRKGRLLLNKWCIDNLKRIKDIFKKGAVDGETVDMLIDSSVGLQVSMGLFPYEGDTQLELLKEVEGEEEVQGEIGKLEPEEEHSDTDNNKEESQNTYGNELKSDKTELEEKELDILKESEYFETELKAAEEDLSKPIPETVLTANSKDQKIDDDPNSLNLTRNDILTKVKWCNYHIGRILECFKQGKDPNEDLAGLLSQPSDKYDEIPQNDINKVIEDVLNDNSGPNDDEDEFKEEDYYYDSDEGEYIHKNKYKEMEESFPVTPKEIHGNGPATTEIKTPVENALNSKKLDEKKKEDVLEKIEEPEPELPPAQPSIAELVAKKSTYKSQTTTPVTDIKILEKQISNEGLLESASKCCKYAISAINYEDTSTALLELEEAMKLLKDYDMKVHGDAIGGTNSSP